MENGEWEWSGNGGRRWEGRRISHSFVRGSGDSDRFEISKGVKGGEKTAGGEEMGGKEAGGGKLRGKNRGSTDRSPKLISSIRGK